MKKLIILLCFIPLCAAGQDQINWSKDIKLNLSDFQSPQTEINSSSNNLSIMLGSLLYFNYNMSRYEFMFTKNFNDKVHNRLTRKNALLTAPDTATSQQVILFAQYAFDLSELYARKFRKALYDNKSTFTKSDYYQKIFSQLEEEQTAEFSRVMKLTQLGQKGDTLQEEHQKILIDLDLYKNFCASCTPPKKMKKK